MSLSLEEQYDKIYRYCYFQVKNIQIAEDLTQETFLKYFSQTSYINRGKPLAYLYTIAKNLCIDHFRKPTENYIKEEKEDLTGKDEISFFETSFVVREAVSALPEDLQEILLLRFGNELNIGEIANIMEMSRFMVYRRIKYALNKLKTVLREEDFHE